MKKSNFSIVQMKLNSILLTIITVQIIQEKLNLWKMELSGKLFYICDTCSLLSADFVVALKFLQIAVKYKIYANSNFYVIHIYLFSFPTHLPRNIKPEDFHSTNHPGIYLYPHLYYLCVILNINSFLFDFPISVHFFNNKTCSARQKLYICTPLKKWISMARNEWPQ